MESSGGKKDEPVGNGPNSVDLLQQVLTILLTSLLPLLAARLVAYAERKLQPAKLEKAESTAPDLPPLTRLPDGDRST